MSLWEYLWAWPAITKWLYHLNGDSTDSSGNWNNGTDTNISYVDGKFGQCASFAWNWKIVTTTPDFWNVFTIALWINHTTWSHCILIDIWRRLSNRCFIAVNYALTGVVNWQMEIFGNDGSVFWRMSPSVNPNLNDWKRHLVWRTRDASNNNYIYIDWVKVVTSANTIPAWDIVSNNVTLWVSLENSANYTWKIDEVIIENVVWSAEKWKKYYAYAKWRFWII